MMRVSESEGHDKSAFRWVSYEVPYMGWDECYDDGLKRAGEPQ